jgi:hypothetical protein
MPSNGLSVLGSAQVDASVLFSGLDGYKVSQCANRDFPKSAHPHRSQSSILLPETKDTHHGGISESFVQMRITAPPASTESTACLRNSCVYK